MTVVLFCGGRVNVRQDLLPKIFDYFLNLFPNMEVIEGDAEGYDRAVGRLAHRRGLTHSKFPINGDVDGHDILAPKRRNRRMLDQGKPDVAVGLPGHNGTLNMLTICHEAGIAVFDVEIEGYAFKVFKWPPLRRKSP